MSTTPKLVREIKPLPGLELLPVQSISQALRLLVGQR